MSNETTKVFKSFFSIHFDGLEAFYNMKFTTPQLYFLENFRLLRNLT